jgi:hypothetical protein
MNLIKNRGFNQPPGALTATLPTHWTLQSQNTVDWGATQDWASGVGRWVGGGPFPKYGQRCLLVGAGDETVTTDGGKELADADECIYEQEVAGAAFADADYLCVRALIADIGADESKTRTKIQVYDGTTTVEDYIDHDDASGVFHEEYLTAPLASLDTTKVWYIRIGWSREAASGTGGADEIPRVYFDDVRTIWTANKGPMRVVKYGDDLAASDDSSASGTTAGTGYAVANAVNRRAAEPYVTGSVSDGYIEINFGSQVYLDTAALIDCDFVGGETWELLYGNASPAANSSGFFPTNNPHNAFMMFARTLCQYIRIEFTKKSGADDKVFKIGELVLGDAMHMQHNYKWGARLADSYDNKILASPYGVDWRYVKSERRSYDMEWNRISDADAHDLRDILDDSKGNAYPVLIVPSPGEYACFYGHFSGGWSTVEQFIDLQSPARLVFSEHPRCAVQT